MARHDEGMDVHGQDNFVRRLCAWEHVNVSEVKPGIGGVGGGVGVIGRVRFCEQGGRCDEQGEPAK